MDGLSQSIATCEKLSTLSPSKATHEQISVASPSKAGKVIKRASNKKSPTKKNQAAANNENASPFKKSGSPAKTFENNKHNKENSPGKKYTSPVKIDQDSIQRPFSDATNSPLKQGIQPFGVKSSDKLVAKVNCFDGTVAALANLKQEAYNNLNSIDWLKNDMQLEENGPVEKQRVEDAPAEEASSPEVRTPLKKPTVEDDVDHELPIFNEEVAEFDEPGILSVIPTDSEIVAPQDPPVER